MFISFFFKQKKSRKSVKVAKTSGRKRGKGNERVVAPTEEEEIMIEVGDEDDGDEDEVAVMEESEISADAVEDDDGYAAHNNAAVKSIRQRAIESMEEHDVFLDPEEEKMAGGIFPKVSPSKLFDSFILISHFSGLWAGPSCS